MGGDSSEIDNTIHVPALDQKRLERATGIVRAFNNLCVDVEPFFAGTKQLLIRKKGFWNWDNTLLDVVVDNHSFSITVLDTLRAPLSHELQENGFSKQVIRSKAPSYFVGMPLIGVAFILDKENEEEQYFIHKKDFQDETTFLHDLEQTLSLLGGQKRPDRKPQPRP